VASVPFISSVEEIFTSGLEQQNFKTFHTPLQPFLFLLFLSLVNIGGGVEIGQNWLGFVKWFETLPWYIAAPKF